MSVDFYTPVAIILGFTFLATLRFSIAGSFQGGDPLTRIVASPVWLYALVLSGPYTLGAFYHGALSPWPPESFAAVNARDGVWAGAAAGIAAATADIWLLWATATTFRKFSPPHDRRLIKYYYVANMTIGLYLMARFSHVIDMGSLGIIG